MMNECQSQLWMNMNKNELISLKKWMEMDENKGPSLNVPI